MKASRRGIDGNRRPVGSWGAAGRQGGKAGCCSHRHSVLLGVSRANLSGLTPPGSGATRLRPTPTRHDRTCTTVPLPDGREARPAEPRCASRRTERAAERERREQQWPRRTARRRCARRASGVQLAGDL